MKFVATAQSACAFFFRREGSDVAVARLKFCAANA